MYEYHATVEKVVDGDTVDLLIDMGLKCFRRERMRLYGINCPEKNTPEGIAAKDFVSTWLMESPGVLLRTHKDKQEKYGRYLAVVCRVLEPNESLNVALIAAGHAKPWDGTGKRPT